jgi:hypothetical protein
MWENNAQDVTPKAFKSGWKRWDKLLREKDNFSIEETRLIAFAAFEELDSVTRFRSSRKQTGTQCINNLKAHRTGMMTEISLA